MAFGKQKQIGVAIAIKPNTIFDHFSAIRIVSMYMYIDLFIGFSDPTHVPMNAFYVLERYIFCMLKFYPLFSISSSAMSINLKICRFFVANIVKHAADIVFVDTKNVI